MLAGDRGDAQPVERLGRDVGLAADDQPGPVEEFRSVAPQLVEQDARLLFGRTPVDRREVAQDDECSRPFDVTQELVTEALALGRAFDQAGNVGEHELVILEPHHAEVRFERGERVVGDLRLRGAHRAEEHQRMK